MTPDNILAQYRIAMARVGEDVIIRRYSGTGAARTHSDVTTKARVMSYQPSELTGEVVQGDVKVIALVDALSGVLPLRTTDFVVIRGAEKSIKGVDDNTRRVEGVLIALEIHVKG